MEEKSVKKLSILMTVTAVSSVCILIVLLITAAFLIPKMNEVYVRVDTACDTLQTTCENLDVLIKDADTLAVDAQAQLTATAEKLDAIDFESLNQAIETLTSVISPLAGLFGGR